MRSSPSRSIRAGALAVAVGALWLAACSDDGPQSGHDSAEEVVAAHVEAGRTFDLAGGCRLRPPEQIEQWAEADATEVDEYCEEATAEVVELADEATRARSEAIYTDPVIEPLSRTDGTWFRITAADGSYEEEILMVEHDGRWYIDDIEVHLHDGDEAGHEEDRPG